jgi:hypothetical protein
MVVVEILAFEGCPNEERAVDLVGEVSKELGVSANLQVIEIADPNAAARYRFLGSPTVRVDGRDVEPGADSRQSYALSCRIYQTEAGPRGVPDRGWLREALRRAISEPAPVAPRVP